MTKTIEVGDWDSPGQTVQVDDNATISQVLAAAGRALNATQTVSELNTNSIVSLDEVARDGESYFITQNHTSG